MIESAKQDTPIRVGIIGLGANTRLRHVPGLRACPGVTITAVCNRRPESTRAAAAQFDIPRTFDRWQDLAADPDIDAVVIGTWPYLHAPITLAALEAGKHVLCEARMAMHADEARQMLAARQRRPDLVTQIVPSPLGFTADRVVRRLLAEGFIGDLREVVVLGTSDHLADPATPLHWRQVRQYSGNNMLTLGILHETLCRWVPPPTRVLAQTATFTQARPTESGASGPVATGPVETPDNVRVLTELTGGACGVYHFSGVTRFGPGNQIHLYGSRGTLKYLLSPEDVLLGGQSGDKELCPIPVPPEQALGWRVEAEFIDAIRGRAPIEFTDFASGLRYMQFTDAVAHSATTGRAIDL
jgi:predicted dehydrogenase